MKYSEKKSIQNVPIKRGSKGGMINFGSTVNTNAIIDREKSTIFYSGTPIHANLPMIVTFIWILKPKFYIRFDLASKIV
jgi:hypothetical protein